MSDTKRDGREAFVRLAEARTQACLDKVRLIGNLSAGQYVKSEADVAAIFGAIRTELEAAEARFSKTVKDSKRFTLGA